MDISTLAELVQRRERFPDHGIVFTVTVKGWWWKQRRGQEDAGFGGGPFQTLQDAMVDCLVGRP